MNAVPIVLDISICTQLSIFPDNCFAISSYAQFDTVTLSVSEFHRVGTETENGPDMIVVLCLGRKRRSELDVRNYVVMRCGTEMEYTCETSMLFLVLFKPIWLHLFVEVCILILYVVFS